MFLVRRWTELKSRAPGASLMGLSNTQTLTRSRFRVGKKLPFSWRASRTWSCPSVEVNKHHPW